jgi:hypothetical protein
MLLWPLAVVVIIGVVGFVRWSVVNQKRIVVPKADIAAGQQVRASQFETRDVSVRGLPRSVLTPQARLDGRVTRRAIARGRPVSADALTRPVPALETLLRLTPAKVSAVGVHVGDRVSLSFAPTAADPSIKPVTVPALLVQAPTTKTNALVVSVAADDVDAVLAVAGRADVFLTPE